MLSFVKMNESHLEKVLQWRTQADVTKYMFTDIKYDLVNQHRWFEKIKDSETEKYWIIRCNNQDIGVISLNDIDLKNQRTSAGYYIGEQEYRRLGGMILPYLYNYIFYDLKLNKVTAEILDGNVNIIKLHNIYGFRQVGTLNQHIYKYDAYHDVHIFELMKADWLNLEKKYRKYTVEC